MSKQTVAAMAGIVLSLYVLLQPGHTLNPISPLTTPILVPRSYLPVMVCSDCVAPTPRPTLPAPTDTPTPTVRPTLPGVLHGTR